MASQGGIDLLRGRPTPAIGTTEAKLQQRKLDALKRGIHRIADTTALPYGVHVIALGSVGATVLEQVLRDAPDDLLAVDNSRVTALAIDLAGRDFSAIRALADKLPPERAQIETLELPIPSPDELADTLQRYRAFLQLEYPLYRWNEDYQPWLSAAEAMPQAGPVSRAMAKAIYGRAYYDGARPAHAALRRFADSIDSAPGDAVVCIVFGLADGIGSGMAVDLARHLSNSILGRRVLVAGIGIAPCDGDDLVEGGAALLPLLNELDVMGDEDKNRGVVQSCGDLFKNPFTAGFLVVPQQHVWLATRDLVATHERVAREIASLLTLRRGANLWEMLRLLNWVAAPSTQHSAARTPWGAKWIHVLGFADRAGPLAVGPGLPAQLGLRPGYFPEFIEMRVMDAADPEAVSLADGLDRAFSPEVPPVTVGGGSEFSVQFVLPRVAKTDLDLFFMAKNAYAALSPQSRLLDHSLLLEQGILLSEPSTRLEGMAGASLWGGSSWIAVPMAALEGALEA